MAARLESGPPDPAQIDSYIAIHPEQHGDDLRRLRRSRAGRADGAAADRRRRTRPRLRSGVGWSGSTRSCRTNGFTAASRTVAIGGTELRAAAAEARACSWLASERLKAPVAGPDRDQRRRVGTERRAALGHLRRAVGRQAVQPQVRAGAVPGRASSAAQEPGHRPAQAAGRVPNRGDARAAAGHPEKVSGTYNTCSMCAFPACFTAASCGRKARRARRQHADGRRASTKRRSRTFRACGSFGGATSWAWPPREWDAVRAARQLKVTWEPFAGGVPGSRGRPRQLPCGKDQRRRRLRTRATWRPRCPRGPASLSATYRGPYQSHGTMAPNCAVADVRQGRRPRDVLRSGDLSDTQRRGPVCSGCLPKRSGCSTTRARTPTAAAVTATWRKPRRSCRKSSASRFACSSAARMNSAGTTTAPRIWPMSGRRRRQRQDPRLRVPGLGPRREAGTGYGDAVGRSGRRAARSTSPGGGFGALYSGAAVADRHVRRSRTGCCRITASSGGGI